MSYLLLLIISMLGAYAYERVTTIRVKPVKGATKLVVEHQNDSGMVLKKETITTHTFRYSPAMNMYSPTYN